jgi:hypothetical protein
MENHYRRSGDLKKIDSAGDPGEDQFGRRSWRRSIRPAILEKIDLVGDPRGNMYFGGRVKSFKKKWLKLNLSVTLGVICILVDG